MNEYFLELLRAAIELRPPQKPPDGMDWEAMYRLAEAHSVANTLYFGIEQLNEEDRPTKELYGKFKRAKDIVLGRETMQFFELGNLFVILENEKVAFVPLKGWVMKNLYPRVEMRSMCE